MPATCSGRHTRREALEIMIELNNKYALDGRNPRGELAGQSDLIWRSDAERLPVGDPLPISHWQDASGTSGTHHERALARSAVPDHFGSGDRQQLATLRSTSSTGRFSRGDGSRRS